MTCREKILYNIPAPVSHSSVPSQQSQMPSPTFFKSMTMILYVWGGSPGQRGWSRPCDQHSHRKTFHWDKQRCLVRLSRPAFGAGKTDFDRIYYIVNLAITVVVVDLDERNSVAPIETSEIWSRVVKRGHLRADLGLRPKKVFVIHLPLWSIYLSPNPPWPRSHWAGGQKGQVPPQDHYLRHYRGKTLGNQLHSSQARAFLRAIVKWLHRFHTA